MILATFAGMSAISVTLRPKLSLCNQDRASRYAVLISQRQRFILPGTADEACHVDTAIICPQDAQHPRAMPNIQSVWQVGLRTLPLDRMSVARRGCLTGMQFVERRPVPEDPWLRPQLDHPHPVALYLKRAALAQQWQQMVTNLPRPSIARRYKTDRQCAFRVCTRSFSLR